MAASDCRYFSGYKPCGKIDSLTKECSSSCSSYELARTRVLLIHLGALGAVVRSTALLPSIRRKYPKAHITWVTDGPADILLRGHPLVDRVIVANNDGLVSLMALRFDVALVVDKSLKASGLLRATKAKEIFGFVANPQTGGIEPANSSARELWEIGISDRLKFQVNRKSETQLIQEALDLGPWRRDPYSLYLTDDEKNESLRRRAVWSDAGRSSVIGINTGCAATIPYKKLSVDGHVKLLTELSRMTDGPKGFELVLLGGKEDSERNRMIAEKCQFLGIRVTESPTDHGLRDGMMSIAACDVVVTGDSLGMHMALGFEKRVVAWFGPTCGHEIDLYGGASILTQAPCAPCWKRSCQKEVMCYDQIDFREMARAVCALLERGPAAADDRRSERLENAPEL